MRLIFHEYSAFTVCLNSGRTTRFMDIKSLAGCLAEQGKVREFMARKISPVNLFFTVVLASQLSRFWSSQCLKHARIFPLTRAPTGQNGFYGFGKNMYILF
jgi:hypothetical protein